ncbi:hypothetical protein Tco_1203300 [Tanacetum coccineum]
MEDVVVVANDLCSSKIQTISVDFSKPLISNPHEFNFVAKGQFCRVYISWYQSEDFLIRCLKGRNQGILMLSCVIFMARMEERLDQFVDQFANRMNDMMNLRRYYGVAGDDYEGAPIFDDNYEKALVFDDEQFKEELMPIYDTDIKDVIEEEE